MTWLRSLRAWWQRTYGDELRRQRHMVEEEARALNGFVTWND